MIIKHPLFNIIKKQDTNSHICLTLHTVCTGATQLHRSIGKVP